MKKILVFLLIFSMALALAGCAGTEPSGAQSFSSGQPEASSQTMESSAPADDPAQKTTGGETAAYYLQKADEVVVTDTQVTFTDDTGRGEMTVDKNPQKVAVLYGSLACLWYEAGGQAQSVIGGKSAASLYQEQIGRDITQDEGVSVVSQSASGANWDVETILAQQPDLIICSVGMKGFETISGPAEAAGIPVIGIDYDAVQDYLKWFKVFCSLNGQPQLWDSVADRTAQGVIDVVSRVPEEGQAPRAVILVISSDVLKAYTGASQPGVILKELGGVNLADPDNTQTASSVEISMEDLYAMDPDLIFLSEFGETTLDTLKELYGEDPVWNSLDAVKENKLFALEKALFHNKANQKYDQSYRSMAQILYPDTDFEG